VLGEFGSLVVAGCSGRWAVRRGQEGRSIWDAARARAMTGTRSSGDAGDAGGELFACGGGLDDGAQRGLVLGGEPDVALFVQGGEEPFAAAEMVGDDARDDAGALGDVGEADRGLAVLLEGLHRRTEDPLAPNDVR
jgi:hypothetical protein